MKKYLLKATTILSITAFFASQNVSAQQVDQAATFLKTGVDNSKNFGNAYLGPLMKGFGLGLNDGWNNNTARPLGTGGFDLRFNLGMFFVPSKDQTYKLDETFKNAPGSNTTIVPQANTPNEQSTMFGPNNSNNGGMDIMSHYTIAGHDSSVKMTGFNLPRGLGIPLFFSLPSIQLSAGIIKNTEVIFRYMPVISIGGKFNTGTLGIGVKHDLKQWIPVIKDQPIWDWSVIGAFSSFNAEYAFGSSGGLQPDGNSYNPNPGIDYTNQKIIMSGNGLMLGTLVSAKLLFFTPYLGINYSYSSFKLKFTGNYAVPVPNDDPATLAQGRYSKIANQTDPLTIDGTMSNMRLNLGFRLKFLLMVIGAEYSIGAYNTATLSVGFNLQSIVPFKL